MKHELKKSESIYKGKILDISVDYFELDDGREVPIEIIHHNGGACIVPLFDDGRIGLVRQWRYVLDRYSLEIPAGRIELGDSPEATAARELEEEFGYRADSFTKLSEFYVAPGYCREKIHLFLAKGLEQSSQNLDEDEEIEIVTLGLEEAMSKVHCGEIDDAKSIIALHLVSSLMG